MSAEFFHALEVTVWLSLFGAPLGCFIVFRRLSFLGDALSHATLSGVAVASLLFGLNFLALSLGAVVAALTTHLLLQYFERSWKLTPDLALTVSYSGLFGLGLFLLSRQGQSLEHFLVGDIRSANDEALNFLRLWTLIVIGTISFFWKPLWLGAVDPVLARSLGYSRWSTQSILVVLMAVSVVGMMQTVGVVLVATYLVFPAVTAMPWVRSLSGLLLGSLLSALIASGVGLWIWSLDPSYRSAPVFSLSAFCLFILSHVSRWTLRPRLD